MDYYYSPYGTVVQNEKYMKFDESVDQRRVVQFDSKGKKHIEFEDPFQRRQILGEVYWTKLKDRIFDTETSVLQGIQRHVQLQKETNNYLTKLDLIDHHPEIYVKNL